jgi:hydrogenase maturation protease
MTTGAAKIVVIGVGNEYRSDDGAGLAVARRLRAQLPAEVSTLEHSGEGASLLETWQGYGSVIVVDAVHSGAAPGAIHRFDAGSAPVPSRFFHYSTHAFSVAEAVELARSLGQLPAKLIVYGIEGASFAAGRGLSPGVEQAAVELAARIKSEVFALFESADR